jgi:hypothetical protein
VSAHLRVEPAGAPQITKGFPLAPLAAARPPGKGSGRISEDLARRTCRLRGTSVTPERYPKDTLPQRVEGTGTENGCAVS